MLNKEKKVQPTSKSPNDSKPIVSCCGFFHEAPQSDIDSLIDNKGTWGDIMERYKQPDWCNYPNALEGQMGCWSLTDLSPDGLRNKISESFCQSCPEFKKLGSHSS